MTLQKITIGLCLSVVVGVLVVVFIVNTENTARPSYELPQQPTAGSTQETYYYTSTYGPYSEFYYPEQCTRFAYRVPPMFRKKFAFLEALHATYPGKTLDPDCLYLVRNS